MASDSRQSNESSDLLKSEDFGDDSWVELHYNSSSNSSNNSSSSPTPPMVFSHSSPTPPLHRTLNPDSSDAGPSIMEKLLAEAQRESRTPSRGTSVGGSRVASQPGSKASSQSGSPKSPPSPTTTSPIPEWSSERSKEEIGSDWIWDWSSRPDAQQSFENWQERFRHPGHKGRSALSSRRAGVMKPPRLFSWANLPTLLITHAASFFLGAAAMLIYMRKHIDLPAPVIQIAISPVD